MNPSTLVLHVLGGTLGGLMSGIALGVLGIATRFLTPRFSSLSGLLVSLALVVAGLFDMGLLHDYTNRLTRQTPGSWICSLGPKGALFSWAFDVGTGVTTRLPLAGVGALLLYAWSSSSLSVSVAVMGLYGSIRALGVATVVSLSRSRFELAADSLTRAAHLVTPMVGCVLVTWGMALLWLPA